MTNPFDIQLGDALNIAGVPARAVLDDDVEVVGSFKDWMNKGNDELERRQWSLWYPIYLRDARFMLYYDYQQAILKPPGKRGYITQKVDEKDRVFHFNTVKEHVDEVVSMWLSVAPKIDFTLRDDDGENEQTKIEAFESFNDYCNLEHLTPLYVQGCGKYAIGFGAYYGETFFDPDSGKGTEIEPQFQDVGIDGYQASICKVCGHVDDGAVPACTDCGSPLIQPINVPAISGRIPTGEQKVAKGEIEDLLRLPCQVRYSLVTGFNDSSFFYIEEEALRETIQKKYGKKSVEKANTRFNQDDMIYPIRMLRQAERGEMSGVFGKDDDEEGVLAQRFFRQPELLHYVALGEAYDLPGFGQIPANVRLSEVFPDGMWVKRIKGQDDVLEGGAGSYRDRFTQGIFSLTPGRTDPQGAKELPEMNKLSNMVKSGMLVNLLKYLNPPIAVVDEVYGKEPIFNRADPIMRVSGAKLGAFNMQLAGSAFPIAPPPMSQGIFPAIQLLDSATQAAGKAQTQDSADPNIDSSTATAWKIGEGRFTRNAGLYMTAFGQYITSHFKKKLELARQNYGDVRQIACGDEDGGRTARLLKKTDLEAEVVITIRSESLQPNLKLEKREATKDAGAFALELLKLNIPITPPIERQINKAYGTDIKFNDQDDRLEECEEQLENARANLASVHGMDPAAAAMQLYMQSPVDANRLGHDEHGSWWREWLSSSQGRKADPVLQLLANMYIDANAAAEMQEPQFIQARATQGAILVQNMPPPLPPPMPMPGGPMPPQGMPANA